MLMIIISPECIQPLREEVESIVKEQGWTKASLFNMRKLDSFLREALRTSGVSTSKVLQPSTFFSYLHLPVAMQRKALTDFTFSDGTLIPKGTQVAAIIGPLNMDEDIYEDPLSFKPFRFAEAREAGDDARDAVKNQMVTTSPQHLLFGHGRHAW
jgi:Cytochrome P450